MFYSKTTGGFYDSAIHGDAIPADAAEITVEEHQALLEGQSQGKRIVADEAGHPVLADPPPPTDEQIIAQYTTGVQQHLDAFARTRNYDDILSAATYATWAKCYEILAAVEAGSRSMPTLEELVFELPVLVWPTTDGVNG